MYNLIPQLWPLPTPGDHDLNKLESTLPEDASILSFSGLIVCENNTFKDFLYIFLCKT